MNLRDLQSGDLKVTKGFGDAAGRIRVHVSLRRAAFVNKTFWLQETRLGEPETLFRVKQPLQRQLQKKADIIQNFQNPKS